MARFLLTRLVAATRCPRCQSSLFDQCSGGELKLVPVTGDEIVDGVYELTLDEPLQGQGLTFKEASKKIQDKFTELNEDLKIEYDNIAFIFPRDTGGKGGLATMGGNDQMYGE